MSEMYCNPDAPPDYEPVEPDIQMYTPFNPIMNQFRVNKNFVSRLHLLEEMLLMTPSESEEETEARQEKTQETKLVEIQQNHIKLEMAETFDSLNAFIAECKNKSILSEKEVKEKRQKKKRSKHSKQLEKLNRRHKNKSSNSSSTPHNPLISGRSTSQSSTSSTERSSRHHNSTTLNKSSIRNTSPNHRSASPQQCTGIYKSRRSKRSPSPRRRLPSRQQCSRSRRSSRTASRSRSPTRLSPSRRFNSHHYSSSRRSPHTSSRSPSPTRSSPSRRSNSHHYSTSRRSPRTPSRSPSPARSSPSRRSNSHHYSSSRRSHIRTPSRSPSFERLPSQYKSNYESSSKGYLSRSNKSISYQSSQKHVGSPERSSSRYKSSNKSSKNSTSPSHRSSLHQQALSPRTSPGHCSSVRSDKLSSRPKSSVSEDSKRCKSPNNKSLIRQSKFKIENDYTKFLAREMAKRNIWGGSDLEEESEVTEEIVVTDEETRTPVKKEPVNRTKDLSQKEQNSVDAKSQMVKDDEQSQSNSRLPKSKFLKQEIKSESPDLKGYNSYYCSACQLSLNSEVTWQSHIIGKKHAKVLKMQNVHEVAKRSIEIPSSSAFLSEDTPRFGYPAAGKVRRPIKDIPRLQPAIDSTRDHPILGLKCVSEIRSEKEITYYCELCDAPCSAHSIMPHLTGYKHQLRFLKEIDPVCYERNKLCPRKEFDYHLSKILFDHERKFGRGQMKVFDELDGTEERQSFEAHSRPGQSWRNSPPIKNEENTEANSEIPPNDACLDTSKADFYCKLCDAHMNNMNMWEAHVRGKRHLRNAKKIPGESISKVRSSKAPPHVTSKLEELINEKAADQIIVGLDSIRETQGPNGENYTCFPCGSNCTNFDIIDHLFLTKHRIRYLEKLVADGKPNGITTISQMEIQEDYFRKNLIDDECLKMMEKYGSGTPEVYLTKN